MTDWTRGYFNLMTHTQTELELIKRWIYNEAVCLNIHATLLSPCSWRLLMHFNYFSSNIVLFLYFYVRKDRLLNQTKWALIGIIFSSPSYHFNATSTHVRVVLFASLTSVAPWESCWFTSSPCLSSSWMSPSMRLSVDARVSFIISWVIPDDRDHKQDRSI